MSNAELLEFPCDFPIKVMGETRDDFAQTIVEVVQQNAPDFDATGVEMRASSGGKYISLTCTVADQPPLRQGGALNSHWAAWRARGHKRAGMGE